MHRRDGDRSPTRFDGDASLFRHTECQSEQRFRRRGTQTHDDVRLDEAQLVLQPWKARAHLAGVRCFVQPAFGAGISRPLEVLHRVGDVDVVTIDAGGVERVVEQPAGRANERPTRTILHVARLFTDNDDTCRARPLAEHGLCAHLPEIAAATPGRRGAQLW